ncbi:MAG: hypothetical protein Q9183_004084 [Haloplaca sp. 2 TL-2023]
MKKRVALPLVFENVCTNAHSISPRFICLQCRYRSSLRRSPIRTSLHAIHTSSLHRPRPACLRPASRVGQRNYANKPGGIEKMQDGITNFMKKRLFKEDPTLPQKPESPQPQPDTEVEAPTVSPPDDVVEGGEAVPPHRRNPSDDPSYIPAASGEGLEMIGGLTGWWENAWDEQYQFRGFNRPEPVLDPGAVTQAISRAVVEVVLLKEPGTSEYKIPEPRPDETPWDDLVPLPEFRCSQDLDGVISLESRNGEQDWFRVARQLRPLTEGEEAMLDDSNEVSEEVNEAEEEVTGPAVGEDNVPYRLKTGKSERGTIHYRSLRMSEMANTAREEVSQPAAPQEKVDEVSAHNDGKIENETGEEEKSVPNPAAEEDAKIEEQQGQQEKSIPDQISAQEHVKVESALGEQEELVSNPAAEDNVKVEEVGKLEESVPNPAAEGEAKVEGELGELKEALPKQVSAQEDAQVGRALGEQEALEPNPAAEDNFKVERELRKLEESVPDPAMDDDAKVEGKREEHEESVPNSAAEDRVSNTKENYYSDLQGSSSLPDLQNDARDGAEFDELVPDPAAEDIAGVEKELGEEEQVVPVPGAGDVVPITEEEYYSGLQGLISLGDPHFKFAVSPIPPVPSYSMSSRTNRKRRSSNERANSWANVFPTPSSNTSPIHRSSDRISSSPRRPRNCTKHSPSHSKLYLKARLRSHRCLSSGM